jgi:GDPmannose 4,6-dehydratase
VPKTAVVTGVTGQDGAYLASFLLKKGYKVYGTYRRTSSTNLWRLRYLGLMSQENFSLIDFELIDQASAFHLLKKTWPDEIYNLAAQSFVGVSFDQPLATAGITGVGPVHLLEAVRLLKPDAKFYQASTSEMFGKVQDLPQTESTPFYPRSPYGAAKLYAHWMTINYRESYGLFAVCGILFNHESPLRGIEFVTRKITDAVARIKAGQQAQLEVGNLSAKRDWGYALEYVDGMWRMLQLDEPETIILATGRTLTVRDFIATAFKYVDIDIVWQGSGEAERGICAKTGKTLVKVDKRFYRPAEVDILLGSPEKAKRLLGWEPKTTLEELCALMMEADLKRVADGHE